MIHSLHCSLLTGPACTLIAAPFPEQPQELDVSSAVLTSPPSEPLQRFQVHTSLLCAYSSYFAAALTSPFLEARIQSITLEESPEILTTAVYWLYSGTIQHSSSCARPRNVQAHLVEIWLFADRRGMPALQNAALDAMHASVIDEWDFGDRVIITRLFEDAPRSSGILDWVVELYAVFANVKRLDKWEDEEAKAEDRLPGLFLFKLARRLVAMVDGCPRSADFSGVLQWLDLCQFHEHVNGESCSSLAVNGEAVKEENPKWVYGEKMVEKGKKGRRRPSRA